MTRRWQICLGCSLIVVATGLGYQSGRRARPEPDAGSATKRVGSPEGGARGEQVRRPGLLMRATPPSVESASVADVRTALVDGVTIRDLFDREERDSRWSAAVEAVLREVVTQFQRDVLPYTTDLALECRASACQISFFVPTERAQEAHAMIQALPLGRVMQPFIETASDPQHLRISQTVLYPADQRDPSAIRSRFDAEVARLFPDGFAQVRTWLDAHPEAVANKPSASEAAR